jgi:hypothetical protein
LTALLGLSLAASLVTVAFVPKDQWREAVAFIHAGSRNGDLVVLLPGDGIYPFDYYDAGRTVRIGVGPSTSPADLESQRRSHGRIWLISVRANIFDPAAKIQSWLDTNARLLTKRDFFRVQTRLYRTD